MTQDSLGDLSMKPTRDELAQRQTSRSKPAKGGAPQAPRSKPPVRVSNASSQAGLWSVLIVLLVCTAGGGWYLWDKVERLQSNLTQSTQALATAEQALSGLQKKLQNRDNTLSKSGDQMLSDIKLLETEVRKLWDLSNKRNKVDIAQQGEQIKKLLADLKANSGTVSGMSKQVTVTAEQVATVKKQFKELQESNSTLVKSMDSQKKELAQLKSLVGSAGDFDDRITSLEVAIKAIDAHRSQVNGRLEKLDKELGQLIQRAPGG
jgi:chromosome segregation ATPase